VAGSSALPAGGPLTVSGAFLECGVGAASLAAAGAAPREHRGGHLAAARRLEAGGGSEV
jgi:hypothetical protein